MLEEVGGWEVVLSRFETDHVSEMERYSQRNMILLLDFDNDAYRLKEVKERIPPHLHDRVFVLGAFSEPEQLRRQGLGTYEEIGLNLATECREQSGSVWKHALLHHNAGDLERLYEIVHAILFST